jgi:hypothetical protein
MSVARSIAGRFDYLWWAEWEGASRLYARSAVSCGIVLAWAHTARGSGPPISASALAIAPRSANRYRVAVAIRHNGAWGFHWGWLRGSDAIRVCTGGIRGTSSAVQASVKLRWARTTSRPCPTKLARATATSSCRSSDARCSSTAVGKGAHGGAIRVSCISVSACRTILLWVETDTALTAVCAVPAVSAVAAAAGC